MKKKKVLLNMRVYPEDKREFQDICYALKNAKISQAEIFSEMVRWLKNNHEKLRIKYTSHVY